MATLALDISKVYLYIKASSTRWRVFSKTETFFFVFKKICVHT